MSCQLRGLDMLDVLLEGYELLGFRNFTPSPTPCGFRARPTSPSSADVLASA
jgi:hypothetical protein